MVSLRRATAGDFSQLLDLYEAVAAEGRWIGTEPGFDRERYRSNWLRWLDDPRFLLIVVVDEGMIVGNLAVYPDLNVGFQLGMLVAASHRGRGVGRALLEHALDWAREHAIPAVHLFVFPHNDRAIALYRSMGFVQIERYPADVKRASGEVWDTLLMRRELV
ncbi:MAG TPA: GNAT family N-acetyltransferase [Candidatus Baltobacteraceae bacterium]|nr:GNAT family N-acetyltransferase [Candidatus Baltobacteraceae bacterium]